MKLNWLLFCAAMGPLTPVAGHESGLRPALGRARKLASAAIVFGSRRPDLAVVSGTVTDEKGQPLPGVTVLVKGTALGATTDNQGAYSLGLPEGLPNATLVFSFVGYAPQEVVVGGRTNVSVQLQVDTKSLEEVVVVGYGTQKRADVTGAIASVSAKEISKSVASTVDQALQGRVAGVVVSQNSGQPGGGVSVQIRGIGTLNGDQEPLYVIDGVIIPPNQRDSRAQTYVGNSGGGTNPLSSLNPSEIESIDILKDASATAIYGAQAANGVVVVTTRRGKTGPPRLEVESYYGWQQLPKTLPMMKLQPFADLATTKAGITGYVAKPELVNARYLGDGTDWQQELFRTVPMYNATLRLSGGDARTQYLLSGSYFGQQGIALGSKFQRASARLNLDNKTTSFLKIGTSLQFSAIKEDINSTQYDLIKAATSLTPDIAVRNPDGSFGGPSGSAIQSYNPNPVAAATLNTNLSNRDQALANVYGEIYFLKDFTLRNEVSGNFDLGEVHQFFPTFTVGSITSNTNSANESSTKSISWTARNYLTYSHTFAKLYSLNAFVGHESSAGTFQSISAARRGFPSNTVTAIDAGDAQSATNGGGKGDWAIESYFGRITLGFNDRYLLTANLRRDGSSNFAPGNRWVTTHAFAFAWKLANEKFMRALPVVSDLKLRLGYGLTNNQNVGSYVYGARINLVPTGLGPGSLVANIANPEAQWETTTGYNLGLDLGLFNNRLTLTADAYTRKTNNLLLRLPLPIYGGTTGTGGLQSPYFNIGSIENKGIEFALTTRNIDNQRLTWTSNATFSLNRNKILTLNTENAAITQSVDNASRIVSRTGVGQSIGEFYGYVVDGMFNTAADFEGAARPAGTNGQRLPIDRQNGIWIGDLKYKDLNGDGLINEKDLTSLGSPVPKFQYGLSNTLTCQGFDLTVSINGNYASKILNYNRVKLEDPNANFTGYLATVDNYARLGLLDPTGSNTDVNNVVVTNPGTTVPAIRVAGDVNQNSRISSRFIEDGSYLRLKNLVLGYTLPGPLAARAHLSSVRVYGNVQNLFTLTGYSGYDPEVGAAPYNSSLYGFDWGRYPAARVYTVGFNFGF